MRNYWSDSRFCKWILAKNNIPSPIALSEKEWENYHEKYDNLPASKFVNFLNKIQKILYYPIDKFHEIRIFLRNIFIYKLHYLKTNLPLGEYYDLEHRMLHGLFNEFVIYIEIEKASMNYSYFKKHNIKYNLWFPNRSPEAGLDYLKWEIENSWGKEQKEQAQWELDAYNWWKYERPKRIDPYAETYPKFQNGKIIQNIVNSKGWKDVVKTCCELEEQYDEEDTKWLIELIKRRTKLWT